MGTDRMSLRPGLLSQPCRVPQDRYMTSVLWFRRDLRLHDLPALEGAMGSGPVAPLFVIDPALIHGRWRSSNRTSFMLACLAELDRNLRLRGNQLNVRTGKPIEAVARFAAEVGAGDVFVSRDYTPYARTRDGAVHRALQAANVGFHARKGTLVHEPEDIRTDAGAPYSVFTPFLRRWRSLARRDISVAPDLIPGPTGISPGVLPSVQSLGLSRPTAVLIEAGETAALRRLAEWATSGMAGYATGRDVLAANHTSRLSQDLRFGTISPLQVLTALGRESDDAEKFASEIAWREFYYHTLWHHPRVLREPFQAQFGSLRWAEEPNRFDAWKQGRTGFPIVDAAMRQLLATGFMHNRARMIVASFLTKDLHIDWRRGEAHFMEHLVDGDVANNNGGWQWAASTGADSQPYFRIFNPLLQSKKFDPEGLYVRRWVAELANVPNSRIHDPSTMTAEEQRDAGCVIGRDYPAPIVEHSMERERALALYAEARDRATRSG